MDVEQEDLLGRGGCRVGNVFAMLLVLKASIDSYRTLYHSYGITSNVFLYRELNELRRPVSDNPEILRFFRYMRAARRGQEGTNCLEAHPACSVTTTPSHTMIAAYHDINKLVTARKLRH